MEDYLRVTVLNGPVWVFVWLFVALVAICFFHLVMRIIEFVYAKERDEPIVRCWQTITEKNEFDKALRQSIPDEDHRLAYACHIESMVRKIASHDLSDKNKKQ